MKKKLSGTAKKTLKYGHIVIECLNIQKNKKKAKSFVSHKSLTFGERLVILYIGEQELQTADWVGSRIKNYEFNIRKLQFKICNVKHGIK